MASATSLGAPAPVTARDKMLADTLRQLELLREEEERTVIELRRDSSSMKELEYEYLSTVDMARYTDGRSFQAAGSVGHTANWEKTVDAEASVEDIEQRFQQHEAKARRERDRLKRFSDKRSDLLARLTVQSRHLLSEADWAAAAAYLESSGHPPAKSGGVEHAIASLTHHPVHAEGLLHAIMRTQVLLPAQVGGGSVASGSSSARRVE
jgi:hypothetical protein